MKLIKENNFYKLIQDNIVLVKINVNENIDIHYSFGKLSLKNCEAIENGYDLDELAVLCTKEETTIVGNQKMAIGFIEGAKTILELLGDKKFSELDLYRAFTTNSAGNEDTIRDRFYNVLLPSLQQTEWDVWLVMACGLPDGCTEPEVTCTCDIIPSLDADGCLILKPKI